MKTKLSFAIIIASMLFAMCTNKKPFNPEDLNRINNFSTATITKTVLNEEIASSFTGTLIFIASSSNDDVMVVMQSLPELNRMYNDDDVLDTVMPFMQHGNVSLVNTSDGVIGVMPKHMFGEDVNLYTILNEAGFNTNAKGDFVTIRIKKKQAVIEDELLVKLDPDKLENAPCVINALNCYEGDTNIYHYIVTGFLHYLTPEEQNYLFQNAYNSVGEKIAASPDSGMYVVKVPDDLTGDIFGMSGGSVTVTIDGKDYFFGMNTQRMIFASISRQDTTYNLLMSIQPIVMSDLQ